MHTSMAATETATAAPLFICKFQSHTVYLGKLAFFQINSNAGDAMCRQIEHYETV